jgi:hypothetical protein
MMYDGGTGYYQDDEYMVQEDDWDREGLLDPAWERQQKKVRLRIARIVLAETSKNITTFSRIHTPLIMYPPKA